MEKFILSILFLTATFWSVAQEQSVSGIVIDNVSKESLIGANVVYAKGKGVITDIDGKFSLQLKEGEYTLSISYIGYKTMELDIIVGNTPLELEVALEIITLNEVEIVADIAQSRRSPVAFSSISQQVIQEEGGNQDLPMLLNTTPSVYATQEGGGVGDAEIIMRGFDQRNLAVMVDGIPVNDMENGRVYWSNWNLPVANMQVQRGLSISKLATPSVGGTINVITPGIIGEKKFQIQQQFASGNFLKTDFTFNSGKLKNGWGYAIALSYWQGDGIIDGTWSQGGSYFAKLEKITGKHRISLTGFGAPQKHGQRSFKNPMSVYNRDYAREIGFDAGALDSVPEYGMTYNEHWGTYEDYEFIGIGTEHPITGELSFDHWRITRHGSKITLNERSNFFHKPMFSLRDFWTISNRSVLVTTVYASFGRGGGTGLDSRGNAKFENTLAFPDSLVFTGTIGQLDFQSLYNGNRQAVNNSDYGFINIDPQYSNSEIKGSDFIRANMNNHNWFGFLSQFSHSMGEHLNLSTGIDLRTYKGSHFGEVYNLIGADYTLDVSDANQGERVARVGDKVAYYNVSYVRWAGGYGQLEYSSDKLTAFVNATIAHTRYKRIDFFKLREEASKPEETDWITFMGFTAKGGINYNLTERHSVYGNLGTLNNAPKFNTVINFSNEVNDDVENERIYSTELGYKYSSPRFALAFNGYYTIWENRQVNRNISVPYPSEAVNGDPLTDASAYIAAIDALHMGVELNFTFNISPMWQLTGVSSIGDWTWQSAEKLDYTQDGIVLEDADGNVLQYEFDATGVHVGAAPQNQFGLGVEFKPSIASYIRLRYMYYDKFFSEFNATTLSGENQRKESWQVPGYGLMNLFMGYTFDLSFGNLKAGISVFNVLDTIHIAKALNNETRSRFISTANFDAMSAGVFPGLPRRFSFSLLLEI